jgi:hypothetical protein
MKKLASLKGVKILGRAQQKSVRGSGTAVCDPCAGKSIGDKCRWNCGTTIGVCTTGTGGGVLGCNIQ